MSTANKLTYLNTTKTKIREGLNSLGADLDTEDTFRSYADAIEGIYEDYPKITGEGTDLSLDNTKQASMQIDYKGNASQNGEPTPTSPIPINVVSGDNEINVVGKNLLVPDTTTTRTSNGITSVINEDGSLTLTGTATANAYLKFTSDMTLESNTTYTTLNQNSILPNNVTMYYNSVGNIGSTYADTVISPGGRLKTYTTGEVNGTISIAILVQTGVTINTTLYPMLLKGTYTTSNIPTYEPYIGNSYPIYLGVKNLWNYEDIKSGFLPQSGSYPTTSSSYPNARYVLVNLLAGQSITLSGSTSTFGRVRYIDKDTNQVVGMINKGETDYYKSSAFYTGQFDEGTITAKKEVIIGIMDMSGAVNNLVVNYGTTPQTISETPIELCKIGTYQDYIYKDNGSWYLHKEIGKVVLDGTYTFFKSSTSSIDRFGISFDNIGIGSLVNSLSLSSHLVYKASANANPQTFYISTSNSTMYIDFSNYGETTLSDFTTWLSANTPAFYLILATPTNTEITDTTLLEQLEESKLSYVSQTNISQENNDLPFNLDVKALRGE